MDGENIELDLPKPIIDKQDTDILIDNHSEITEKPPPNCKIIYPGERFYHGRYSDYKISEWPLPPAASGNYDQGLYMSRNPETANHYSNADYGDDGARVYPLTPKRNLALLIDTKFNGPVDDSLIKRFAETALADTPDGTKRLKDEIEKDRNREDRSYNSIQIADTVLKAKGFASTELNISGTEWINLKHKIMKDAGYSGITDPKMDIICIFNPDDVDTSFDEPVVIAPNNMTSEPNINSISRLLNLIRIKK